MLLFRQSYTARQQLANILNDGNTVAWYEPPGLTGNLGASDVLNCSKWANTTRIATTAGTSADLLQATALNQPIIPSKDYVPKLYVPTTASNTVTTPSSSAITTVTTGAVFCVEADISCDVWSGATEIGGQWAGAGTRSWIFRVTGAGLLNVFLSLDGTNTDGGASKSSSTGLPGSFVAGFRGKVRFSRTSATGVIQFHYSTDSGATWTKLGNDVSSTAGPLFSSASVVYFGTGGGTGASSTRIYSVTLAASLGGVAVVSMNAADSPETSTNGATFVSSATGETYTLNNTGATPAQICRTPILLGDGAASFMQCTGLSSQTTFTAGFVINQPTWTLNRMIWDGHNGTDNRMPVGDANGTPKIGSPLGGNQVSPTLGTWNTLIVTSDGTGANGMLFYLNGAAGITATSPTLAWTGFTLFRNGSSASYGNCMIKEAFVRVPVASTALVSSLSALFKSIHGTP